MGADITLTTPDNFALGAYVAEPAGSAKGAVVVIQEIFGVLCLVLSLVSLTRLQWSLSAKIIDLMQLIG